MEINAWCVPVTWRPLACAENGPIWIAERHFKNTEDGFGLQLMQTAAVMA